MKYLFLKQILILSFFLILYPSFLGFTLYLIFEKSEYSFISLLSIIGLAKNFPLIWDLRNRNLKEEEKFSFFLWLFSLLSLILLLIIAVFGDMLIFDFLGSSFTYSANEDNPSTDPRGDLGTRFRNAGGVTTLVMGSAYGTYWLFKKGRGGPPPLSPNSFTVEAGRVFNRPYLFRPRLIHGRLEKFPPLPPRINPQQQPIAVEPWIDPGLAASFTLAGLAADLADFTTPSNIIPSFLELLFGPTNAKVDAKAKADAAKIVAEAQAREVEVVARNNEMMTYLRPSSIVENLTMLPDANGVIVPGHLIYGRRLSDGAVHEFFAPIVTQTVRNKSDVIGHIVNRGVVRTNTEGGLSESLDPRFQGFPEVPSLNKYLTCYVNNDLFDFRRKEDCDFIYGYQQQCTGEMGDLVQLLFYRESVEPLGVDSPKLKVFAVTSNPIEDEPTPAQLLEFARAFRDDPEFRKLFADSLEPSQIENLTIFLEAAIIASFFAGLGGVLFS